MIKMRHPETNQPVNVLTESDLRGLQNRTTVFEVDGVRFGEPDIPMVDPALAAAFPRVGEFALGDPMYDPRDTSISEENVIKPVLVDNRGADPSMKAWLQVMASHSRHPLMWGPTDVDRFILDPKRIAFFMSRYKFAAKMLRRAKSIIDVGCGSGMGTLTFLSDTDATTVMGVDFEQEVIDHAVKHLMPAAAALRDDADKLEFVCRDFSESAYINFDGLCCLDVIEHLNPGSASKFFNRAQACLTGDGIAVFGTPSIHAAQYGSKHSQIGHINLYDADRLRAELELRFRHVLMFSMSDEVVHTGFDKMAHYFLAVAIK